MRRHLQDQRELAALPLPERVEEFERRQMEAQASGGGGASAWPAAAADVGNVVSRATPNRGALAAAAGAARPQTSATRHRR